MQPPTVMVPAGSEAHFRAMLEHARGFAKSPSTLSTLDVLSFVLSHEQRGKELVNMFRRCVELRLSIGKVIQTCYAWVQTYVPGVRCRLCSRWNDTLSNRSCSECQRHLAEYVCLQLVPSDPSMQGGNLRSYYEEVLGILSDMRVHYDEAVLVHLEEFVFVRPVYFSSFVHQANQRGFDVFEKDVYLTDTVYQGILKRQREEWIAFSSSGEKMPFYWFPDAILSTVTYKLRLKPNIRSFPSPASKRRVATVQSTFDRTTGHLLPLPESVLHSTTAAHEVQAQEGDDLLSPRLMPFRDDATHEALRLL